GPVAGGLLAEHLGWQSIFLINLPLGVLAGVLVLRLPPSPHPSGRWQVDAWGILLFAALVAALILGIERAQHLDPAALPSLLGLVALAILALVLLIIREQRASYPLLPIALLRQASIWRSDALAACHGAALVSLITFMPMYLIVVRGISPAQVGLLL